MLLTLPLVPVFMWLIGRYTESARESAGRRCARSPRTSSTSCGACRRCARSTGARLRRPRSPPSASATARPPWGRCAWRFLSGSVLELAATLGVALVAVTVGRAPGRRRHRPASRRSRCSCSRPSCTSRSAGSARSSTPAPTAWPSPSAPRAARRAARAVAARRERLAPSPPAATVRLEGVLFAYPARPGLVLDGVDLELAPGRDRGAGRRERRRQEHGRAPAAAPRRADRGPDHRRRRRPRRPATPTRGARRSPGCRSARDPARERVADNIRLGDPAAPTSACARPPVAPAPTRSSARSRRLRHGRRRRRAPALGGRAPPPRARARVPARRPARDPRRADGRSRPRQRRVHRGGVDELPARSDGAADRPRPELSRHADRVVSGAGRRVAEPRAEAA